MGINVLFFGQLTDIVDQSKIQIDLFTDTDSLVQAFNQQFPKLGLSNYALVVNKKHINKNTILNHGDEVAFLPAFSGG